MKSVIITGSTRGIGFNLAKEFLARDCVVTLCGRNVSGVADAVVALSESADPDRILGVRCDVTEYESVQALWNVATDKFGRVDIWINNAGTTTIPVKLWETPVDEMDATLYAKVLGALYCARVVVEGMRKQGGGAIYFMEGTGTRGDVQEGTSTLGTGNNAVVYLMKALVKEYKGQDIIFGGIRPGINVTKHLVHGWEHLSEKRRTETKRIFNILGDIPETTTPVLAEKILANRKTGVTIRWMTGRKMMLRFLTAPFSKRDLFVDLEK